MSSVSAAFGLRAAFHPSGTIRSAAGTLTSATGSNIFANSPCKVDPTTGDILGAAAGARAVGTFQGVEFVNAQGRWQVSNWYPTGTVMGSDPAPIVYYTQDPWIVYEIQANGSVARTSLGAMADWTALAGSTGTGNSTVMLDTATLADTASGLQIVGISKGPDNDWGDSYTVVQVQIAEHQFVASRPTLA